MHKPKPSASFLADARAGDCKSEYPYWLPLDFFLASLADLQMLP